MKLKHFLQKPYKFKGVFYFFPFKWNFLLLIKVYNSRIYYMKRGKLPHLYNKRLKEI